MKKTKKFEYLEFIPEMAKEDEKLTESQRNLLGTLVYLQGKYSQQQNSKGYFFCSAKDLVKESGISKPTVLKGVNLLQTLGYIERGFDSEKGTSLYKLTLPINFTTKQVENKEVRGGKGNADLPVNFTLDIEKDIEIESNRRSNSNSNTINSKEMENKITYTKDNLSITYYFGKVEEAIEVIKSLEKEFGTTTTLTSTLTPTSSFENSKKEIIRETKEDKIEDTKEEKGNNYVIPTPTIEVRAINTTPTSTFSLEDSLKESELNNSKVEVVSKVESTTKSNDYKTTQEKVGKAITRLRTLTKEVKLIERLEEDSDYHKALRSAQEWLNAVTNDLTPKQLQLLRQMTKELGEVIAAKTPRVEKPHKPLLDEFNSSEYFKGDPLTSCELVGLLTLKASRAVDVQNCDEAKEAYDFALKAYKETTNAEKEDEAMKSKLTELKRLKIKINELDAANAVEDFEKAANEAMELARNGEVKAANKKWIEANKLKYNFHLQDPNDLEKKIREAVKEAMAA